MAEKEYIEREAAIEAAIDAADEWDGGYNPHRAAQIRDGVNAIPAADVRPVEWIPVTERLPEVRTWVLCYCRANSFDVFRMTDEGNWQYGNRSIYMKCYVTHWMPLPPTPKEET